MTQDKHVRRSRLPRGMASKNPVMMRLSDDEYEELNVIAIRESRSMSSMARIIYLNAVKIALDGHVRCSNLPRRDRSKNKLVAMRLSNVELAELYLIAEREDRPISNMARILYLSSVENFR
ncbi:hypothetical protein Xmau_04327 [Xenorhabdus mauleonii]|uniref:Ribbon-helix-helix protein, copG family n=1 Tax=Xenorhabdus mauleonii TaxID=351675 RepID=A0A1I3XIC9_9GAMM|nr:hypothetical protein [Xenorhabdus mauleonii]PHM36183.1 hypothetical protein Xmau_04327 [Xenorhabdus mauleonii]SFK19283.1 hypothetical protein SAMN05421680_13529 [Xenorhabdus mauleonii]